MLKSDRNFPLQLANFLLKFFCESARLPSDFLRFHDLVMGSVRFLVKKQHLTRVVSENQINETVLDFMEEVFSSPEESRLCSKILAEIRLKKEPSVEFIQFYAIRRLFTILKRHAESRSLEYLRFDSQIKKTLQQLSACGKIFFALPDYYAAEEPDQMPEISRFQIENRVLAEIPLKRFLSASGRSVINRNLKSSICMLLKTPPHHLFKFRKRLISSTLFRLSDGNGDKFSDFVEVANNSASGFNFSSDEESAVAEESFKGQMKIFVKKEEKKLMILLALGYFYCVYPDYFNTGDILPQHFAELRGNAGMIDRLQAFLIKSSEELALDFKWKRTTIFYRLDRLKMFLRLALSDCSILAGQKFIRRLLASYLKVYRLCFREVK